MHQPLSSVYRTDSHRDCIDYVVNSLKAVFVWISFDGHVGGRRIPRGRYAVAFQLLCDAPYHSVSLAYTIIRFSELICHYGGGRHSDMITLAYSFNSRGVYGVFVYDRHLRHAFRHVARRALRGEANFDLHEGHNPVTIWPTDRENHVIPGSYDALLCRIGCVVFFISPKIWTLLTATGTKAVYV